MEIPARSGLNLGPVDASMKSTPRRSIHSCRRGNLLASPLLRLPTEPTFKSFVHAIEFDEVDQPLSLFNASDIFDRYNSPSFDEHYESTFVPGGPCPEHTSIETLLTALSNCPNLEILSLAQAGPIHLSGHQGNRDVVVQLRKLRRLSISFDDLSGVRLVLYHPESTKLEVYVPVCGYTDETIPNILIHRNVETIQNFRRSTAPPFAWTPVPSS